MQVTKLSSTVYQLITLKALFLLLFTVACQSGTEAQDNDPVKKETATATAQQSNAAAEGEPTLVFYAAGDCEPCDNFKPIWAQVLRTAPEKHPNLKLEMVDCDDPANYDRCAGEADEYGYPTVFLYKPGQSPIYFDDPDTYPALMAFIDRNLK